MDDLRQMTAIAALNKMLKRDYFDICVIDRLAAMFCIFPDPEAYSILRSLHCVDYKDMPAPLYRELPQLIQQALSGSPVHQFQLREAPALPLLPAAIADSTPSQSDPKPPFYKRLLRR